MNCPVCYSYGQAVAAVTQVNGTLYCAAHGVEALAAGDRRPGGSGPRTRLPEFSPPVPTHVTPPPAP